MTNWQYAKRQYDRLVQRKGILVDWLVRTTDTGSVSYDTGSDITFGYGDPVITFTTGSILGIIDHFKADEILTEAGFYLDDYEKFYVDSDSILKQWDQLIIPDDQMYIVISTHTYRASENDQSSSNIVISKYAIIRRLVPKSENSY